MRRALALVWLVALVPLASSAFVLGEDQWPSDSLVFHSGALNGEFKTTFDEALAEWTNGSRFEFRQSDEGVGPCNRRGDPAEGVAFANELCDGERIGRNTLAVTEIIFIGTRRLGAGVTFNSDLAWSVYDGPLRAGSTDVRRVALHELGHVIGLEHTNRGTIMARVVTGIDRLTCDDTRGASAQAARSRPGPRSLCQARAARDDGRFVARALRCQARFARHADREAHRLRLNACLERSEELLAGALARNAGLAVKKSSACSLEASPGVRAADLRANLLTALGVAPVEAPAPGALAATGGGRSAGRAFSRFYSAFARFAASVFSAESRYRADLDGDRRDRRWSRADEVLSNSLEETTRRFGFASPHSAAEVQALFRQIRSASEPVTAGCD